MNLKELDRTKITHQQLFEVLRSKKIFQLGKIKRLYLEACGTFSVYPEEKIKPGLPLFPPDDQSMLQSVTHKNAPLVCTNCGTLKKSNENYCSTCKQQQWTTAVE